jgi:poly(A) polymerase
LPAAERIRDELDAILGGPTPARAVLLLDDLGLLDVYLPELTLARDVDQMGYHHLPVMRHMIEALHQLLHNFPEADLTLRWATLLHDIGKPETRARGDDGRIHFYGHDQLGADMATGLMRRLRHPEARVKRCAKLIRYHMVQLPKNERQARRFVHRRRELLPDLLKLMIADREAARGPLASEANRRAYRIALARVIEILDEAPPRPPLLDGREVMDLLGIDEGPKVGEAVRFVKEAEAVGDIETREEAKQALRRYAKAQGWNIS